MSFDIPTTVGKRSIPGTLINMLTKGLSRGAVILAKYTCLVVIWTASLLASLLGTWGYTANLVPGDTTVHLPCAVICIWLYGVFLLALLMFAAALVNSTYGACSSPASGW